MEAFPKPVQSPFESWWRAKEGGGDHHQIVSPQLKFKVETEFPQSTFDKTPRPILQPKRPEFSKAARCVQQCKAVGQTAAEKYRSCPRIGR